MKALCTRLGVTPSGLDLVMRIRSSEPARRVSANSVNVPCRYPSKKMGCIIQAESHKLELPHVYKMERDNNVLEFYDQPEAIKIQYQTPKGKLVAFYHYADYFAINHDFIGYIECKKESKLVSLSKSQPNRYIQAPDGHWICPPGITAAKGYGLSYKILTDSDFSFAFLENFEILDDYYDSECPPVKNVDVKLVKSILQENKLVSVHTLINEHGINANLIYKLIADDIIFFDIEHMRLSEPSRAFVFLDGIYAEAYQHFSSQNKIDTPYQVQEISLAPGTLIQWDGKPWKILNAGEKTLSLASSENKYVPISRDIFENLIQKGDICSLPSGNDDIVEKQIAEFFEKASPKNMKKALRKYEIVIPIIRGEKDVKEITNIPERTLRCWISNFKQAETELGIGLVGLFPRHANSGNYLPKMPPKIYELMEKIASEDYETSVQKNISSCWGKLCLLCKDNNLNAPCKKTFTKFIKLRNKLKQVAERQGDRAAYNHEEFYWLLERETPRHGTRPFHLVHIDHTEIDLELCSTEDGQNIARAWLTLMVDAYSRRILAFHLSFSKPSYICLMMVIRECVRRHQRVPSTIIVDNGPEFNSLYFELFLARYSITKKSRPKSKSKFGSVIERLFGTTNTELLYSLRGNTQLTKYVRLVTKEFNPKSLSVWTLPLVSVLFYIFYFDIYDLDIHPALKDAPRNFFDKGMFLFGTRPHKIIPYTESFIISTLPSTKKGTVKISETEGVQINYIHYWNDEFKNPEVSGTTVPVKFDPENVGIAYVYIRNRVDGRKVGRWVQCRSDYYAQFKGRSIREITIASIEIREQDKLTRQQKRITAYRLALFLEKAENCEKLLLQRKKDFESNLAAKILAYILGEVKEDPLLDSDTKDVILIENKHPETPSAKDIIVLDEDDIPVLEDF